MRRRFRFPEASHPFGILIHHFTVIANSTPLSALSDPARITDFNGFVGLTPHSRDWIEPRLRAAHVPGGHGLHGWRLRRQGRQALSGDVRFHLTGRLRRSSWTKPDSRLQSPHRLERRLLDDGRAARSSVDVPLRQWPSRVSADDPDLRRSRYPELADRDLPLAFPEIAEVTFNVKWGGILDRQHVTNEAAGLRRGLHPDGSDDRVVGRESLLRISQFTSEPANPAGVASAP